MGLNDTKEERGVSRRDFVKKLTYVAPVITTLVVPKYTAAQPSCPFRCSAVCSAQCPPACGGRCAALCPPACGGR